MTDLSALKRAAMAATAPYKQGSADSQVEHIYAERAFIALANPQAILSLVDECEKLREALKFYAGPENYKSAMRFIMPNSPMRDPAAIAKTPVLVDDGAIARAALGDRE